MTDKSTSQKTNQHKYTSIKTGIYKVTKGQYENAALFLVDIIEPEESEFVYLTIYNPDSEESHEIALEEWQAMSCEDGLEWDSPIPYDIKDQYLHGINPNAASQIPNL